MIAADQGTLRPGTAPGKRGELYHASVVARCDAPPVLDAGEAFSLRNLHRHNRHVPIMSPDLLATAWKSQHILGSQPGRTLRRSKGFACSGLHNSVEHYPWKHLLQKPSG